MTDFLPNFPKELRELRQWCVWKYVLRGEKPSKVPFQPNGKPAESDNDKTWSTYDAVIAVREKWDGIGVFFAPPYAGVDIDDCVTKGENGTLTIDPQAWTIIKNFATYTEFSPSCFKEDEEKGGVKLWLKGKLPGLGRHLPRLEAYDSGRYFAVTGRRVPDTPPIITEAQLCLTEFYSKMDELNAKLPAPQQNSVSPAPATKAKSSKEKIILLAQGRWQDAGYPSQSEADGAYCRYLADVFNGDAERIEVEFLRSGLAREKSRDRSDYLPDTIAKVLKTWKAKKSSGYEGDGSDWREGCKSISQLTDKLPKFLINGLIPEKALTFNCGPSYHSKTWFSLMEAKAVITGESLWCFDGPGEPVPVIYHVPEMNEALVRHYANVLGIEDSEMFLVRPMESGVWMLDDPRMLRSSDGRLVFLDTQGFFNPAEDQKDYKQALNFAQLAFNLLNNGARAIAALAHPPKYATQRGEKEPAWTLENSILGSAGYGGILRSCVRIRNLNLDLNDPAVWLYVQGLKNPGLKPFQLEGPPPLRMKVEPGQSPYLSALLDNLQENEDPRYLKACELFAKNVGQREIKKALDPIALGLVNKWHKRWEKERGEAEPEQMPLREGGF